MKRILGIDTGTNSLGWAVVDKMESGEYVLVKKGSLIFQEGVKIEKGIESSKAAERTKCRASRKHYFRRRLRKIEVLKVLVKYGWCPYLSEEALHKWHVDKVYPMDKAFLEWQRTDDKYDRNPYAYRHICLHEKLNLESECERYKLGRAMYHLAQRRGFLSNRLDQNADSEDTGKVKTSISDLSQKMEESGCVYLGDYFYKLYCEEGNRVRIRCHYTAREEHYKKEFYAICAKQALSDEQIKELERALYFQRPLKSQRQGVGKCTFEPKCPRCADSHPAYERFRMLSFINNIKVKGPYDIDLRPLNEKEREKALLMFYRKSKPQFDFEDIAKAIAGKGNYQYIKDNGDKAYKFNYRMTQGVTGCPTSAALRSIFGTDYMRAVCEQYLLSDSKTCEQMVDDVWNVLYSFADKENVETWGRERLQLDDSQAKEFAKIRLTHNFASLSLKAIRKILPWLEQGMVYAHAVLMAKVPDIVGKSVWQMHEARISRDLIELIETFNAKDETMQGTLESCIKDYLRNNFDLKPGAADRLYHPSMIETYEDAKKNKDDIFQLGSPRTNAVRNPMAMRSLHQLRKVINTLLRERIIDQTTEVHIEYARELNDYNKRAALSKWNKDREKKRAEYEGSIRTMFWEEYGKEFEVKDRDILKFQLWEEQNHRCLYTGEQIGIADFLGSDHPKYDIEHTLPRSAGGDSTMENMTLCSMSFNRQTKLTKLPSELSNYEEIMGRLDVWKQKIEKLRKEMDRIHTSSSLLKDKKDSLIQKRHLLRLELEYWEGKYRRFMMKEIPDGFSRRQGASIGLVGKYAGLYLKSLFHRPNDRNKSNVRVIKGSITAEFRKLWGIQEAYTKKSRDNHIHHCIDAIVIACIGSGEYNATARYYRQLEEYEWGMANRPRFPKPWPTFTEDMKVLEKELLVVHDTPDNMPKQAKRKIKTPQGIKYQRGDTARGSLHKDTHYGAIERNGEIVYVVRKSLSSFEKEKDLDNIVDEAVKAKVKKAVAEKGFKQAMASDIYMNEEKKILIKKVRCLTNIKNPIDIRHHRDVSEKEYKRQCHVQNDENYMLAIYEAVVKGKIKREFELVKMIEAADFFKKSNDKRSFPSVVPQKSAKDYPLRWKLKIGQHVILYEKHPSEIDFSDIKDVSKRLYVITRLSINPAGTGYGSIVMRYHQEARMAKDVKAINGTYKNNETLRASIVMLHTQFNALVEGADFEINAIGEIRLKVSIC